jgi:hypothetical protein
MSKKEKDRAELQKFIERFRLRETESLIYTLSLGFSNPLASQAINTVLKERGIKVKKTI